VSNLHADRAGYGSGDDSRGVAEKLASGGPVLTRQTRRAYSAVRQRILDGALEPGKPISQVSLAAELAVSRTPLREALRLLENEGLVESDYNRRVRAKPLTMPDLETLTAMRLLAEPFGVLLTVPRLDAQSLTEIEAAMNELHERASRDRDPAKIAPLHRRFHFALFAGAEGRLRRHMEDLWDHAERYRHIYLDAAAEREALLVLTKREHELIVAAADARDGQLCARRVAEHIARTSLAVIHQVDIAYDPATIRQALEQGRLTGPIMPAEEAAR
jgi:DNA-binding GntR family transcriptional regulator